MNNRRLYYPAVAYTIVLVALWLLSWLFAVTRLFVDGGGQVRSLVSAEGLRWAVRSAAGTVDTAPWAAVCFFVAVAGVLSGSGMVKSVRGLLHGKNMGINERRAWLFAFFALLLFAIALFAATVAPWHLMLGVTGELSSSPLSQGWLFLLFLLVLLVASVYGYIYGNYRSLIDIARSIGGAFSLFAPALLAVVPASGILPCVEFTGFLAPLGLAPAVFAAAANILYTFPFAYVLCVARSNGRLTL